MGLIRISALVLLAGCASARIYERAHEVRYFDGEQLHRLTVKDVLRVKRVQGGRLQFEIEVSADHGHTCHMSGVAERSGDVFEYSEVLDLPREPGERPVQCLLRLIPAAGTIRLQDSGHNCRMYYCGVRGALDGLEFTRSPGV